MKILVTGGAGFIGSNLALELEKQRHEVTIMDNFFTGVGNNLKEFKGKLIKQDVSEDFEFNDEIEAIFHIAAITDPRYDNDEELYKKNTEGFKNMIKMALKKNAKLVYASSASLYGNGPVPMKEDQEKDLQSAYAKSKLWMDEEAEKYFEKMHIVGLRFFNVFGPRESHKGRPASMIYHLYNQMKSGKIPRLFKWGEQIRDHIYVKDVVYATILALDAKKSGVCNVGTGIGTDFNEIVKVLNNVLGTKLEPEYFDNPYDLKTYQANTLADTTKAEKNLGFKAKFSFSEGVKDYVKWLQANEKKIQRMINDKIKTREELVPVLQKLKKEGKKIGVTNGVFDILHSGHVMYLENARKLCDVLVVSVNTDESVKKYKGDERPIIGEQDRARLVASLESVDYVTFHNERRMRETLESLKPDFYIKGGDYSVEKMTSRDVVEAYGGKAVVLPMVEGISTTEMINKIMKVYGKESETKGEADEVTKATELNIEKLKVSQAVFLDRDGVINKEVEYLHEPDKFEFLPNALDGLKSMQDMGYKLIIVTTQAGIGLGYFTKEDFYKVNRRMFKGLSEKGIIIDKIYFCPHSLSEDCNCRKPKTGLFERGKEELNLDMNRSFMIGDKTDDIQAGKNAGLKTILVKTGHGGRDKNYAVESDFIAEDLIDAAEKIKKEEGK
jgi:ADP-L-glycero-D-manno-heptose 6-epimerase